MTENTDDNIYLAEKIINHKTEKGKSFYLVKWHGWDKSNNTWEPESNILDPKLIENYIKTLKRKGTGKGGGGGANRNKKRTKTTRQTNPKPNDEYEFNDNETNKPVDNPTNKSNSEKTNDLRSVKRIAEGLRPIRKLNTNSSDGSKEQISPVSSASTNKSSTPRLKQTNRLSYVSSSSSSSINDTAKRVKQPRKLSSSISSEESSVPPKKTLIITKKSNKSGIRNNLRKKLNRKSKNNKLKNRVKKLNEDDDESFTTEDDDEHEQNNANEKFNSDINSVNKTTGVILDKIIDKFNNLNDNSDNMLKDDNEKKEGDSDEIQISRAMRRNRINDSCDDDDSLVYKNGEDYAEEEEDDEDENDLNEDDYDDTEDNATCTTFITNVSEDVVITDITSGVVTVTIKESISPDGFFKNRNE